MLTSKQRAALRAMAQQLEPIVQMGKEGIGPALCKQVDDVLEARELIKVTLQKGAPYDTHEACDLLCAEVDAEPVQCIGRRFVLYRQAKDPEKRKIVVPRA